MFLQIIAEAGEIQAGKDNISYYYDIQLLNYFYNYYTYA